MNIIETIFIASICTLVGFVIGMSGKCKKKSINRVHLYVARDKYNNILYLYLSKPRRYTNRFHSNNKGCIVEREGFLYNFGLNTKDFENLKFEDEPVEVFLNLKN